MRTCAKLMTPVVVVSLLAVSACGERAERSGGANTADATGSLADLSERYWEWNLETNPVSATYLGDRRFDDRLADISREGREANRAALEGFQAELAEIDSEALAGQDRLTYLALDGQLGNALASLVCRFPEWQVDHMRGPQSGLMTLARVQRVETPADGERMMRRWEAMGPFVDAHVENLRIGLADSLVAGRYAIDYTIEQLDALLAQPDEEWPLAAPGFEEREDWTQEDLDQFRAGLLAAISDGLRPAFVRYRDFLRDEALPMARDGDQIGLVGLTPGGECYEARIRNYTTLELNAEQIHEIGKQENARIREEMATLGQRVFGTSDVAEVQRRLRTDPAMHFDESEEVLAKAEEATARAREAMPDWFGRLPEAPIIVEEVPDYEAPYTTIAYYRQPAVDGSRPGTYFVNVYAPETRPRYEAEVLAFHEGIPGHHLQIAIAQELDGIPDFRKHTGATAFVEGWALYTERLSDEMDLYSGDVDRLGVLSYDAWRASRLVVDTGIHAFGWTRDQAIDYMNENTLLAENNVANEVDRYIVWPGQALAYKLGQREILRLRELAREQLGENFEIQEFHDRVLENGAVSLAVLGTVIDDWLADQQSTDQEGR